MQGHPCRDDEGIPLIYRRYCGLRMTAFLAVTFYAAMAGAAYVVAFVFGY